MKNCQPRATLIAISLDENEMIEENVVPAALSGDSGSSRLSSGTA
jgi:hypothetical protein